MRNNIEDYLDNLSKKNDKVKVLKNNDKNQKLEHIPNILHDFYENISEVELPFGRILSIDIALEQSKNNPFNPEWFVFGRDNYFSFWLCSYLPDEDGLSFTYWDHESGNEIDGAVWADLESFLQALEEEYINI